MKEDMQDKWQDAMRMVVIIESRIFVMTLFQAKLSTSSGSGVDAANIMLAQLRAQNPRRKKASVVTPPPGEEYQL